MAEIVIVGAGLTGLSTAYHLEKLNFLDYLIVEANERPGGLLRSECHDGFTFDYTGHLLHSNNQYFSSFLNTVADIRNFCYTQRTTSIFSHNVLTDYPFQINLHGLPIDVAVECIEKYVTRATSLKKPRTFHQWILTHFGAGMGKHFFFPYNQKLLAYDLRKVQPDQMGRFVPSTHLSAIIQGTIAKNPPANIGYNSSFYYPRQGGIEFLIKKLCDKLTNKPRTLHRVVHIDTTRKRVYFDNGTSEAYNILITTMPLNNLLEKMSTSAHSSFATAATKLLCNSVININLGFTKDLDIPQHWIYFPEKNMIPYRIGFWHNLCPASVRPGCAAVYGEVAYLPQKTKHQRIDHITEQAINHINIFLQRSATDIAAQKILHIPHAYVIYDKWRERNVPLLLQQLEQHDIYSIGRYGAWKYASMQEAVLDGKDAATKVIEKTHHHHHCMAAIKTNLVHSYKEPIKRIE